MQALEEIENSIISKYIIFTESVLRPQALQCVGVCVCVCVCYRIIFYQEPS